MPWRNSAEIAEFLLPVQTLIQIGVKSTEIKEDKNQFYLNF